MLGLSLGKILVIVGVIVALWRGLRMLTQVRDAIAQPPTGRVDPPRPPAAATVLVECPKCGAFVPNGTICPSREECRYKAGTAGRA
jgi:hypothetical protein